MIVTSFFFVYVNLKLTILRKKLFKVEYSTEKAKSGEPDDAKLPTQNGQRGRRSVRRYCARIANLPAFSTIGGFFVINDAD
jgi:hypothetical protein